MSDVMDGNGDIPLGKIGYISIDRQLLYVTFFSVHLYSWGLDKTDIVFSLKLPWMKCYWFYIPT